WRRSHTSAKPARGGGSSCTRKPPPSPSPSASRTTPTDDGSNPGLHPSYTTDLARGTAGRPGSGPALPGSPGRRYTRMLFPPLRGLSMYAIIRSGGKQTKVRPGDVIDVGLLQSV